MPSREEEVATLLRADSTLEALAIGGIYTENSLGLEGITDATITSDVWSGGVFNASIIVRQRANVPQYRLYDEAAQVVDTVQVVEVYCYALTTATIYTMANRVYTLLTAPANRLSGAYTATWQAGLPVMDAPNLLGVKMQRDDFHVPGLRRAA